MQMKSDYAPVNGLKVYYEIHGANPARPSLVLLHGGGDTIRTSFGYILPELARNRQVIAFEQQGYGRTADIADRPFSFEQSADDTAALLDYLQVRQADLFGFSNGGTIALQVAIRHPVVVRKLVVASGFFSRDAADQGFWNGFAMATLDAMPKELRDSYLEVEGRPRRTRSRVRIRSMRSLRGQVISREDLVWRGDGLLAGRRSGAPILRIVRDKALSLSVAHRVARRAAVRHGQPHSCRNAAQVLALSVLSERASVESASEVSPVAQNGLGLAPAAAPTVGTTAGQRA
jgi:pimeloyl-ACP methyl ester carboxylesterase